MARKLALSITHYSPKLILRYGYAGGQCTARENAPGIVADHQGWTWIAKVRSDLFHWARLYFNDQDADGESMIDQAEGLQPEGRLHGADVTWRAVDVPAEPGYFIVGDAAAVLDPASSHGVLKAIMSGIYAGHAIDEIIQGKTDALSAAWQYGQWMNRRTRHDVTKLRALYSRLPRPPAWLRVSPSRIDSGTV